MCIDYFFSLRRKLSRVREAIFRESTRNEAMQPSLVIFTGGSAFNPTAASLRQLGHHHVAYVVPTTDDGGSSAQILKYFGGPAIGDLRSRLLRLASESTSEARAIKDLLQHRLPSSESTTTNELALNEWREILSGIHPKWKRTISGEFKCTVLRFLQYFDDAVAKKIQESTTSSSSSSSSSSPPPPLGPFDWRNGSIGNFFFTGARLFFGSLNAAIFWWSRVAHIPEGSRVIPAAKRELTRSDDILSMTLGATVQNNSGTVYNVIGQTAISHPPSTSTSTSTSTSSPSPAQDEATTTASKGAGAGAAATAGEPPSSPPSSPPPSDNKIATGLTPFDEDGGKITDIYHVARPSNERVPPPSGNPRALRALDTADVIVYGIGSLFTSIIAGLLPRGVGRSIATNTKALKILCVNGSEDRETHGMSVREYVEAVHRA